MEKELTSRAKQALATKEKIYRVGVDLIREYGFDGVNVSQITKAAGVSVGTFYHYYTSKLDLFMDLYRSADTYYEEKVAQLVKGRPLKEKLLLFFREYCAIAENNGVELIKKMYVPDNSLFLSRDQGMHAVLQEIIRESQETEGICLDKTPQEVDDLLFLIARGVIFDWALHSGEYDLQEKMAEMLNVYLEHITKSCEEK